ncbi:MAG: hypothetical protein ACRDZO_10375 [Egibacteraceae bacterium]
MRALIVYLSVYQHLPADRMAQLLDDVFGAPVSTGTIVNTWPRPRDESRDHAAVGPGQGGLFR